MNPLGDWVEALYMTYSFLSPVVPYVPQNYLMIHRFVDYFPSMTAPALLHPAKQVMWNHSSRVIHFSANVHPFAMT